MSANKFNLNFNLKNPWEKVIKDAIPELERGVAKNFFLQLMKTVIPKHATSEEVVEIMNDVATWGVNAYPSNLPQESKRITVESKHNSPKTESGIVLESQTGEIKDNLSL